MKLLKTFLFLFVIFNSSLVFSSEDIVDIWDENIDSYNEGNILVDDIEEEISQEIQEYTQNVTSWVFNFSDIDRRRLSIDAFKDEQYNNIFFSNQISFSREDLENFRVDDRNQIYQRILDTVVSRTNDYSKRKDNLITRSNSLKEAIEIIDGDIESTTRKIFQLNTSIVNMVREISVTRQEIEELSETIKENRDLLLDYISHIYKKYNLISNNDDIDALRAILINSDNLWILLSELYYSQIIELAWQALINEHRALMKDLFLKRKDLEEQNRELRELRVEEISNKEMLEQKRSFRERILEITQWQEEKYREYIERQKFIEENIQSRIVDSNQTIEAHKNRLKSKYNCDIKEGVYDSHTISFDEETLWIYQKYLQETGSNISIDDRNKEFCDKFNKVLENEIKLIQSNFSDRFLWPILPIRWLSSYYLDPEYEKIVWTSHDAIDIRASQGSDIVAPADWYVIFIRPPVDETYSYFALRHANWFVSVYGHVNEIFVDLYDYVQIWDVIAKSWGAIWTKWAWIMTSGPHLHFELFKDWKYVDPLDFLDLTYLWIDNIPPREKYLYNFLSDFRNKFWFDFDWDLREDINIFSLKWDNEVERQRYLLNTYATPVFRNWDMWVEESLAWSIDPSFVMCIWLAESWLWRALKTPYNVWNVWNTDSWSTWDLPNARSWVYWIVRTLNNRFLWEYDTMNMLSRYWNPDWSIYASSPKNWQRNIVRCLSALKGRHVPDDFRFRLNN